MAANSPTQRTLQLLRSQGYVPWVVERFNAFSGRRTDLYHIIDILCQVPSGTIGVQSCGTDFAGHRTKIMDEETDWTTHWLSSTGCDLVLIGWRKLKYKRGGKLMVYRPRLAVFNLNKKGEIICTELKSEWLRERLGM